MRQRLQSSSTWGEPHKQGTQRIQHYPGTPEQTQRLKHALQKEGI
jgi:hypothetical protein